mgnify:CR=1 FL=1
MSRSPENPMKANEIDLGRLDIQELLELIVKIKDEIQLRLMEQAE